MAKVVVFNEKNEKIGALSESLEKLGHKVEEEHTLKNFHKRDNFEDIDVVLLYQHNGSASVVDLLRGLKGDAKFQGLPIVVITGETTSNDVIEAMKLGAFDHLSIPVASSDLEATVTRALAAPRQSSKSELKSSNSDILIGFCPAMRNIEKLIGLAAGCDSTVLIQGETGTGKDTVARTIYSHSRQGGNPLTVVDCTAVPEDYGSFESLLPGANGTVILDEIGDLNGQMQAMLVRALKESSPVDSASTNAPRIIATTQYDLISMVREKRFREDLYYRLNVLSIVLPPLRERGSDILSLAEAFLSEANPAAPKRLSSASAKVLLDHSWPGNIRELKNLIYHLTYSVRAQIIERGDLSMLSGGDSEGEVGELDYYKAMAAVEKRLLERALKEANGSRTEAARLLGINRQLLYSKLKAHGLMN